MLIFEFAMLFFQQKLTDLVPLVTMFLSFATCMVLILTYRRNSKVELENHLFKLKIEAYSNIIYEVETLFAAIRSVISNFENALHLEATVPESKLREWYELIDKKIPECDSLIVKNSVLFSPAVVILLSKFSENLYGVAPEEGTIYEQLEQMKADFDRQLTTANDANSAMRRELKLDKLSNSLFNRY